MSQTCERDTAGVTETPWERLRRLIDLRRTRLDLTLAGIDEIGGPSPKWVHKLTTLDGPPTPRMRASLQDLDRALQWPDGTSWGIVAEDRSTWDEAMLRDEDAALLEVRDEADHFGWLVAARIRAWPADDRDRVMREVSRFLGMDQ